MTEARCYNLLANEGETVGLQQVAVLRASGREGAASMRRRDEERECTTLVPDLPRGPFEHNSIRFSKAGPSLHPSE